MQQIKGFFSRTAIIVGIFFIQVVQSGQLSLAQETSFEVGVGLMDFDYVEYDDDNVFLDGESGLIPGVIMKLKTNKRIYYELEGSLYYNKIKYDGQTQSGIPITTKSDALIVDTHFKVGLNLEPSFGRKSKMYGGIGYRYWYRNILPTTISSPLSFFNGSSVAGILEEYSWFYGLAGYAVHFNASNNVNVGLDFRLTKMIDAKLDVDFLGFRGYDNNTLSLGNKIGARFAVPITVKTKKYPFFITPYFEIIDIGKSNSVPLTQGGVSTGFGILEPRSETRNVGVEVTWLW